MLASLARARALKAIKTGDVIFGIGASGDGKLLLVYDANERSFFARHVTTQTWAEFGRDGKSRQIESGGRCIIVSTALLPSEEYRIAIGLDNKMRTAKDLADLRLSKAEKQLLLSYEEFFRAHPLPSEDAA